MKLREGSAEEVGMSPRRVELARTLTRRWVDDGINPALVVLAARRGIIVLHEALGVIAPDSDAPPTKLDTIFPMSSISKAITATAAMILVDDGLLGLNRPVQDYIPEFAGDGKGEVMVHHLLTHTSGWDEEAVERFAEERRGTVAIPACPSTQHPAVHEALHLKYDAPLSRPPGERMSYCSPGFDMVGEIVRRVAGKSLDDFARERIFEPLGMRDTAYALPDDKLSRVARRRPLDPPPFGLDSPEYHQQPWPESGLMSTAMDMAHFCQMFLNGGEYGGERILSPVSVREMTRDQIPGIAASFLTQVFPEAGWGYGWSIKGNKKGLEQGSLDSPASFGHGGSGGVYVWVDPTYETVGVYLSVSRVDPTTRRQNWCADLFVNLITAAIEQL